MLLAVLAAGAAFALGLILVLLVSLRICMRVGIDPLATLLWLGLVERPVVAPRESRRRLGDFMAGDEADLDRRARQERRAMARRAAMHAVPSGPGAA